MSFVQNTLDIQWFLNSHGCVIEAVLLMYGVYATWKWALPIRCTSICDGSCQREMTISWWCSLKNILVRTYIREREIAGLLEDHAVQLSWLVVLPVLSLCRASVPLPQYLILVWIPQYRPDSTTLELCTFCLYSCISRLVPLGSTPEQVRNPAE
jgi:hypothetical protein